MNTSSDLGWIFHCNKMDTATTGPVIWLVWTEILQDARYQKKYFYETLRMEGTT